jgi:hypothetical protein
MDRYSKQLYLLYGLEVDDKEDELRQLYAFRMHNCPIK